MNSMKRIMVVGCIGSGKSTFSRKLHIKTGIKLYHLDDYFFEAGIPKDKEEWKEIVEKLSKKDEWIIDGNYPATLSIRANYADTMVLLDLPRIRCMFNVFMRGLKTIFNKERIATQSPLINHFKLSTYKRIYKFNGNRKQRYFSPIINNEAITAHCFTSWKDANKFLNFIER